MSEEVLVSRNSPEDSHMSCFEELEERLKRSQKENAELKRQRTEDAKSNEKVASMFSTQEQNWKAEKKSLRLQIQALFSQFRVIEVKKEEDISCLMKTVEKKESEMQVKNKEVVELLEKNNLLEQKLRNTEQVVDELNQKLGKELDKHSDEVSILMSKHQQLETEVRQALQKMESMKLELDEALQKKNEAVETVKKISKDVAGFRKDKDQKQQILSAILRVSKHDNTEKKLLLKEMKMSKMRRKQAELESERWMAEPRRRKGSSRLLELSGLENKFQLNEREGSIITIDESDKQRPRVEADELIMIDVKNLQEWIESETEKCTVVLQQRHCKEINAFAEQMRLKDEKIESFRLKLRRSDFEHKCLQTRIYNLEETISGTKQEKFNFQTNSNIWHGSDFLDPQTLWSDMKINRRNPSEEAQDVEGGDTMKPVAGDGTPEENDRQEKEACVDPGNLPKYFPWKVDINAMGVSYKIKRLKQQFIVIEKLISREADLSKSYRINGFYLLLSLTNKQVQRYQTLEERTDELCKRMNQNEQVRQSRDGASDGRASEQVRVLEMFLGETFKLQRYMVATGQKLLEIQSTIACSFINNAKDNKRHDKLAGYNTAQFFDIVRCLMKEIQRGMEVRITQIIVNLEGILAREVITRF